MPSPFPGMDPYLEDEKLWPAFHHKLVAYLYQILVPGQIELYLGRIKQRRYSIAPDTVALLSYEEVFDGLSSPKAESPSQANDLDVAVVEEFIEIRQRGDDKPITHIDIVSPLNKRVPEGRAAYHETRKQAREKGCSVVEIDLLKEGQPMLDYPREGLPDWDFCITVTRASHPERYEIYTTTLQKKLSRFKIPLSSNDRDIVLDLQSAFTHCYDEGAFGYHIDYTKDPPVSLSDEDLKWVGELLKLQKMR